MQLELQNKSSYSFNENTPINKFVLEILKESGTPISFDEFKQHLEFENIEETKKTALKFNSHVKNISKEQYRKIMTPITAYVTKVYSNGYIDATTTLNDGNSVWTHIYNPTIFQHLEIGDEVLLGHYEGEQKSNCWVMFAKIKNSEFSKKTINKDINNLNIINNNIQFLKKWMKDIGVKGEFFNDVK